MSGGLVDDYLAQLLGAAAASQPATVPTPPPLEPPAPDPPAPLPDPEPPRAAAAPPAPAPRPIAMSPSSPDEISEDEFEALLDNLHGGKPPGAVELPAAAPPPALAPSPKSPDEISEDEFEALLDNLHGGKPPGAVVLPAAAPKPAPAGDEISEDEFEALLDNLHGGKPPGTVAFAPAAPAAAPHAPHATHGHVPPPDGPNEDDPNWRGEERRAGRRNSRWLRLRVHQQDYGVELLKVQEVLLPVGVLAMRDTDVSMLGVMNLRGVVVPVIDLGLWLGLEEVLEDAQTRFVVLEQNGDCLALKVSSVLDVHAIGDAEIEPAENTLASPSSAMLRGVTRLNSQPVILLDAAGLLG